IVRLHVVDTFSQSSAKTLAMYYVSKDDKKKILNRERDAAFEEMAHRNRQAFIRQHLGLEDGLYPEQLGLKIENKVVFGNVEEEILLQSVNSNCDLIGMGAHEKPFLTFTTPLSKRVVKRSKVPVTAVPIPAERKVRSTGFLPSFFHQFSAAGSK
ncbi:MAG: universal stress protein, partial [Desulfopila sp.]|nr:universal stress protein [Desulfopila sp.]